MQDFLPVINILFGIGATLLALNGLVSLYFFFTKKENGYTKWIQKNALWFGFLIPLLSVCASLFYSDVIGYTPCKLCWLARIFMYPQLCMFFLALVKKVPVRIHSIAFCIIGIIITLYHNWIYIGGYSPLPCDAAASCTQRFVFELGYITIPFMALAAFVGLIGVMLLYKEPKENN
jgi:disulfide bond formation protein DsbB